MHHQCFSVVLLYSIYGTRVRAGGGVVYRSSDLILNVQALVFNNKSDDLAEGISFL